MSTAGFLAFLLLLVLLVAAWLAGPPLLQALRRARVRRQPFPLRWRQVLRRRMPAFAQLPAQLQLRLKKSAQVLLAEVPFIGCAGLVVTDEMRVLVATQAALLLAGNGAAHGFPGLRDVLLYPGPFVVERSEAGADGLVHASRHALAGESWQHGRVVLSWPDVLAGTADASDGHNVVIHEFAHQLDHAGGRNGAGGNISQAPWLASALQALRERLARAEPELIDPYAATNAAEFFAVTSEHFFEQPLALAAAHPVLFGELVRCWRVDPRAWLQAGTTRR